MDLMDANRIDGNVPGVSANIDIPGGPEVWKRVCARLSRDFETAEYDKWVATLRFISEVEGYVLIAAKSRFAFDRVNTEYRRDIERVWRKLDPKTRPLRLECWTNVSADIRSLMGDPWDSDTDQSGVSVSQELDPETDSICVGPDIMRFETLVTGPSNKVAATVARSIAQQREQVPASIIVINGMQGVGKTHLLKALESALETDITCKVAYISAEEFLVSYVDGAKNGDTRALKSRVRDANIVLFDDLQTIAGKRGTNDELSATLRTVANRGGIAVLTADRAPADMQGLSTGVMTVLKGAACIEITMPDNSMRLEIVRQRARLLQMSSPNFIMDDVLCAEIVSRVQGPGRDLCGVVISLFTETGLGAIAPNLEMLDRVLSRQQKPKTVSLEMIKRAVYKSFELQRGDLEGGRKFQPLVQARQIGMYLARELTDKSFPQIGIAFGNRHHTTALYAWRKVSQSLKAKPEVLVDVDRVKQAISHLQSAANT